MKNQLLIGSALLATFVANSQGSTPKATLTLKDPNRHLTSQIYNPNEPAIKALAPTVNTNQSSVKAKTTASTSVSWNIIGGSMNIFGVLTTDQKPLQYNDELNTVSFIHRKSATYVSNPVASPSTAASGVIVGTITKDWGNTWDSTAVWNNNVNNARYPQGGIYNPPGNTNLSNAYVVVTGPIVVQGSSWVGNYAASKKLDVFNNAASSATMAQQFLPSTSPLPGNGVNKVGFLRNDFCSPDDGRVWAMGGIYADVNGTDRQTQLFTGARILKGTFNSTTSAFDWSGDSIIPPVVVTTTAGPTGAKNTPMLLDSRMAWSESGQIGYVYFIGSLQGRTGRNKGFQPIVYRTIDHGATWHPIDGINFNDTAYYNKPVLNHIPGVSGDTLFKMPQFQFGGNSPGIDAVVDKDGYLHLAACVTGHGNKNNVDSLFSGFTFSLSSDNESGYSFGHVPGFRPYIYDFICKPTSATSTLSSSLWNVVVVDSMLTEAPDTRINQPGYNDNPWDADPTNSNSKQASDPRLQLSRTPDGKYIVFTWTESDTIFTNGVKKWNSLPDIKARVMDVARGYSINPIEINLTTPETNAEPEVSTKAFMHYTSPKCKLVTEYTVSPNLGATGVEILLPVTVSNSNPLSQQTSNRHWYASAALSFTWTTVGVTENNFASVQNSVIFPNPTKNNATLSINMKESSSVNVSVMNTVGQVVKSNTVNAIAGDNKIDVDVRGLASGIYLVNVKSGNSVSTKKLIVE